MDYPKARIEAAARALATDLQHTIPTKLTASTAGAQSPRVPSPPPTRT